MRNLLLAVLAGAIFLCLGIFTIHDYGISWDEPEHLRRGQAYLWYFLTGELDYKNIPEYNLKEAQTNKNYHDRSFYKQFQFYNNKSPVIEDRGHPPLGDIISASLNTIFFQKLGILGDIESYHLFQILASSLLVATVFWIGIENFGLWTGIFSAIFLMTYPLFFAESHFNIKDPAQASFFTLTVYLFWKGFIAKKNSFILLSAVFAGVALGIKFNVFFALLTLFLWLVVYFIKSRAEVLTRIFNSKTLLSLFVFLPVMLTIFFVSWPYLWVDPIARISQSFRFYEKLGTEANYQPSFILGPLNLYPIEWIIFTTPPIILVSFVLGLFAIVKLWNKHWKILSLLLLWFLIPIIRVSFSGLSIYGGVRQIMEYIPAMALIAGLGITYLTRNILKVKNNWINLIILSICLIFLISSLVKLHPFENVYFNFLVGGLPGAVDKNIPSSGNTLGNVYVDGLQWINNNAPQGSKLSLIQGTTSNLPLYKIRSDINYSNNNWSGIQRGGEYLMDMTYIYDVEDYHYAWEYVDKILEPVYILKVNDVTLFKIWKNDLEHTKTEYKKEEKIYTGKISQQTEKNMLILFFDDQVSLSRLLLNYKSLPECQVLETGFIEISNDGETWVREKDAVPSFQVGRKKDLDQSHFTYYFAASQAKLLRIVTNSENSCLFNNSEAQIYTL